MKVPFLALEGTDIENNLGVLNELTEHTLKTLLGSEGGTQSHILLVFVSACYSEPIGKIFKQAGVPIVVAVNKDYPISDMIARVFAKQFYGQLARGMEPREAFRSAKDFLKT